jgi:hypothetical protein
MFQLEAVELVNLTVLCSLEVFLSQIIPAFRFVPSTAEIVWRFGALSSPSVKGSVESFSPELPIIVSMI